MTSNAAASRIAEHCADLEGQPTDDELTEAIQPELLRTFKPAFLGRVTVVPYLPLDDAVMRQIVEMQLARIARQLREHHNVTIGYSGDVVAAVSEACRASLIGARSVSHVLSKRLLPELSAWLLSLPSDGKHPDRAVVSLADDDSFSFIAS
jgi:type VI secretion system protein VasG